MKRFEQSIVRFSVFSLSILMLSVVAFAQTVRTPLDVTNYKMDVNLNPSLNKIDATVDVDFVPKKETRTITFELNGSLKIESVSHWR